MAKLFYQTLAVMQIISILQPAISERFFQYRDHRDQSRFLKIENRNEVHDEAQAEVSVVYLQ